MQGTGGVALSTLAHAFVCAAVRETRRSAGRCKFTGVTTPAAPPFPGRASTRLAWLRLGDLPATSPKPRTPGAACCPLAGRDVALGQLAVGARQLERSWPRFSAQILIVS